MAAHASRFLRSDLFRVGASACALASYNARIRKSECLCVRSSTQQRELKEHLPFPGDKEDLHSRYALGRTLGEGSFASVKLATNRQTGRDYALKFCYKRRASSRSIATEAEALRVAGPHQHIVSLFEEFDLDDSHALLLELVTGGEVFDRVCEGKYSEREAAGLVRQLAHALAHIHSRGIVHRDVKPENLLLVLGAESDSVKLCDFGLAGLVDADAPPHTGLRGKVGTVGYMAPEMLDGCEYGTEVDLWALGVVLYVLLVGYLPFDPCNDQSDEEIEVAIREGRWSMDGESWESVSVDACALVRRLLEADPAKRATIAEVLRTPWVVGSAASGRKQSPGSLFD